MGKSGGQIDGLNVPDAEEAGIFHGVGKAVAPPGIGGRAEVIGAVFPQVFPADVFIARLSVGAGKPAAFVAQKFHLLLLRRRQGI